MQQLTPLHALMLAITVAACGIFIVAARRVRGTSREKFARQMVGWALLVLGTAWTVISLDPKQFDIRESLLYTCATCYAPSWRWDLSPATSTR